ncbi:beta-1,4-N-acetylgalactosaminyltransferase bre-4-like isoform X2 [Uloborus diversus]|uniref:beta-1,4-N-acetylgalactosaminyltransferase bre-4-like isoform X2 n=1 Tax=Uloborus diversus TaxID=327109 RepID=UPI002409FCC3|nr:beta-1,4-N-acetylgalactosaminyltransferase bre-4-like isoform X2 [Uloborus diversus]
MTFESVIRCSYRKIRKVLNRRLVRRDHCFLLFILLSWIGLVSLIIILMPSKPLKYDIRYQTLLPNDPTQIRKIQSEFNGDIEALRNKAKFNKILDLFVVSPEKELDRVAHCKNFTYLSELQCDDDRIRKFCRRKPCGDPEFMGRLFTSPASHNQSEVEALLLRSSYMRGRGSWTPKACAPRHRVAIIIPYRDRLEHLWTLLYTLHPLLQRQLVEYRIYVVEQFGNDTFNKGVLMNAGVREALRDSDFQCFVFHDVDMIPEDDRNVYSCPPMPRHLSVAVDKFNYTLPYSLLVGGVFSIKLEHFLAVNGYSNLYWGWGGEDDDMGYRIKYRKLEIIRPPEMLGRYTMIKHEHRPESPNAIRSALLRMAKKRSSRDGLNTVKYRVVWRHDLVAYTHLMIDIGNHHRWHFLNGQRLVINF